jgi:hypothetical protein
MALTRLVRICRTSFSGCRFSEDSRLDPELRTVTLTSGIPAVIYQSESKSVAFCSTWLIGKRFGKLQTGKTRDLRKTLVQYHRAKVDFELRSKFNKSEKEKPRGPIILEKTVPTLRVECFE